MSVNFFATQIMILDAPATNIFMKDAVLCADADGNVYRYDMPKDHAREEDTWPRFEEGKGIPLFRNYWTFLYNLNNPTRLGPYYRAIENAPKTIVIPPIGTNEL